ncbi:MAG: hypothetical protein DRJ03_01165 [Chloroflexi bacterium]|nr:MAG: hypothetical protein DRJ03_01165 [Chloroflexota bacterium]
MRQGEIKMIDKVFVYGTLKVGHALAYQLDDLRTSSKEGYIKNAVMYSLGPYPAIKTKNIPGRRVYGEVHTYKQFREVLRRLDQIEGFNPDKPKTSFYSREITTVYIEGEEPVEAHVYTMNNGWRNLGDDQIIQSGKWEGRE